MFLHMLSDKQQTLFLKIAHLVGISDNPLLWDGKAENDLTGDTDLSKVSVQSCEHEKAILESFVRECTKADASSNFLAHRSFFENIFREDEVWDSLLKKLKPLPLGKQNDPESRIRAAAEVLEELLKGDAGLVHEPSVPKIMLYELMLLALADGSISSVEGVLLKQFAARTKLEEFIYDDLLEHAQNISHEVNKTLSLILE